MNKMRTLMLLHERQVLTPDQRVRLNKLHEQMFKDKDRGKSRDKEARIRNQGSVEVKNVASGREAMTRNGSIWTFTAALALAALPTPGLAQQVSDTRLRELMAAGGRSASRVAISTRSRRRGRPARPRQRCGSRLTRR